MRNAVCDIGEFIRGIFIEIVENRFFQDIGMQCGNAVDMIRSDYAEVRHTYAAVADYGHARNAVPIARIGIPKLCAEAPVDLLDNGVDSG